MRRRFVFEISVGERLGWEDCITQYDMSRKMTESFVKNRVGHSERGFGEWTSSPDEARHERGPDSQAAPE